MRFEFEYLSDLEVEFEIALEYEKCAQVWWSSVTVSLTGLSSKIQQGQTLALRIVKTITFELPGSGSVIICNGSGIPLFQHYYGVSTRLGTYGSIYGRYGIKIRLLIWQLNDKVTSYVAVKKL
jgi:hypothetical protein